MQISRHWRLNANRYRLEGVRYENGTVSLQERPMTQAGGSPEGEPVSISEQPIANASADTAVVHALADSGDPEQIAAD